MPADSYAVAIPVGDNYRPRRAEQGSSNQNPTVRGSLAAQGNRIDDTRRPSRSWCVITISRFCDWRFT